MLGVTLLMVPVFAFADYRLFNLSIRAPCSCSSRGKACSGRVAVGT